MLLAHRYPMAATAAELTSDSMGAPPVGILRAENKSPVAFVAGLSRVVSSRQRAFLSQRGAVY